MLVHDLFLVFNYLIVNLGDDGYEEVQHDDQVEELVRQPDEPDDADYDVGLDCFEGFFLVVVEGFVEGDIEWGCDVTD